MADLNDHGREVVSAMELPENMTCEGYVEFVTNLASKYSMGDFNAKVGTAALGLTGETAEIAWLLSEATMERGITPSIKLKILDELSDILWYAAFAAGNVINVPFEKLCGLNSSIVYEPDGLFALKELDANLRYLVQGTGGFADIAKKLMFHGKTYDEDYRQKLWDKLQTTVTYMLMLARVICNAEVQDLINHNVKKLSARYKSLKFTTEEFLAKENAKCQNS